MRHLVPKRRKCPGIDPGKTFRSPNSNEERPPENEEISFEPDMEEGEKGKPPAYRVVINQEDQ